MRPSLSAVLLYQFTGFRVGPTMCPCVPGGSPATSCVKCCAVPDHDVLEAFNKTAPALIEATNAAVDSAEAYLASRASLAAIREQFEGILRLAREKNFPAADIPVILASP